MFEQEQLQQDEGELLPPEPSQLGYGYEDDRFLNYIMEFRDVLELWEKSLKGYYIDPVSLRWTPCQEGKEKINQRGLSAIKAQVIPVINKHVKYGNLKHDEALSITREVCLTVLSDLIMHLEDYDVELEDVRFLVFMVGRMVFPALTMAKDGMLARLSKTMFQNVETHQTHADNSKGKGMLSNFFRFGGK